LLQLKGQERKQDYTLHIAVRERFACIGMDFKEVDKSFEMHNHLLGTLLTTWSDSLEKPMHKI